MMKHHVHPQSPSRIDKTINDSLRVLRLGKHAPVVLRHQFHAMLLEPLVRISLTKRLKKPLHEPVTSWIGLLQIADMGEVISQVTPSTARNADLSQHLSGLLIDGNIGVLGH